MDISDAEKLLKEKEAKEAQAKEEQKANAAKKPAIVDIGITEKQEKLLRGKIRAVAYSNGKLDLHKLFRFYDRDNSEGICIEEFTSMSRRDGKLTTADVSDSDLNKFFKSLDLASDGRLSFHEFQLWLDDKRKVTRRGAAEGKKLIGSVPEFLCLADSSKAAAS